MAPWSPASTVEHFGGDETLVRGLVRLFVENSPRMLESLRSALSSGDLQRLARTAHALKGSIANFTSEGPAKTASELERLCVLGQRDAAEATLHQLEQEMSRLVTAMKLFEESTCTF